VFDLFGDHLRHRGGEVRLRALVALMGCFEVPEATVRVVVARLRREGWLASRRDGRETVYALTPAAWQLLDEGRVRIFERVRGPWDGHWHMAVYSVPETDRALRQQLRSRLAWLGYGPLAGSVYVSPHDRSAPLAEAFADRPAVRLDLFRSRSTGAAADRDIAARAWDLTGLAADYTALLDRHRPRLDRYRAGAVTGVDALRERIGLVNDYRRFPFRDPDLPAELLPPDWPGRRAHELVLEAHGLLRRPAEEFVDGILDVSASRRPSGG
jgi:phenylacetic acid degradation operon negative regulatory protein